MKKQIIATTAILIIIISIISIYSPPIFDYSFKFFLSSNYISILGLLISFFGLVIIYIQTLETLKIAKESKQISENTRKEMLEGLDIINLTILSKNNSEIKSYNRDKKYELSLLRMNELRDGFLKIKENYKYNSIIGVGKCRQHITSLSLDISNIESILSNSNYNIDTIKLNENLDKILISINEINAKLRYIEVKNE